MSQKQKYLTSVILIFLLAGASIYGLVKRNIDLGLDIRGGLNVILTAKGTKKNPVNKRTMEQALFIMRNRVDKLGVSEPIIEQHGSRNIIVQLPGVKDAKKAINIIGQTALLEFGIVQDKYTQEPEINDLNKALKKKEKVLGETLMTGDALTSASAGFDQEVKAQNSYIVSLKFTNKGADDFAKITANNKNKRMAIVLDGKIITAPTIQEEITGGSAQIEGIDSLEEAKEVALVLQTGQLPFKLEIAQQQQVGPTLGKDSLNAALIAMIIGFILVALYMLIYYRIFGLIAWAALAAFAALLFGSLLLLDIMMESVGAAGISLSLPSIAGIILMIGIAADSSIIVFERIKEEVREGRSLRSAIDIGFSRGFKTFLDADLVTFLTAAILFNFGVGPIKGFAMILMVGIFIDIIISLLFKRSILKLIAINNWIKNPALIGIRGANSE